MDVLKNFNSEEGKNENRKYLAHRTEEREQTILEHLQGTAKRAGQFAAPFGKEKQGELAGALHDIGKYSAEYQYRIRNPETTEKCDHSTAGALEAFNLCQLLIAICIMGHHGGLPNLGSNMDTSGDGTFQGRLKKGRERNIPDYSRWEKERRALQLVTAPEMEVSQSAFSRYMETKFLYSALVDADFLDTEFFVCNGKVARGGCDTMETALEKLEIWLKERKWLEAKSGINRMRSNILQIAALRGEGWGRGIYTLTVPTGGGKTISSLRFALHHGVTYGMDRIIYVVPYTNIIEQTAKKFREIMGAENVLEHHSGVINEEDGEDGNRFRLASENWDMPIIVTTAVQFFESLFHHKPSHCRKLHNIANSVIIYDEVQMLPVSYWIPCLKAMEELAVSFRTTQVLCTATQPAISFSDRIQPQEIMVSTRTYFEKLKRVTFVDGRCMTLTDVADKILSCEQTLCIVNTKRTARQIYELLGEKEDVFHLTTMMVPAHREETLLVIRKRLEEKLTCRVVATSLVEAGVDLDFQYVLRQQAGLDAILQAAGRCNRNGERKKEESRTEVFSMEGRIPDNIRQQVDAARCVMGKYEEWDSLDAIEEYFRLWRSLRGKSNLDRKNIIEKVEQYAFREISESFRLIESDTYVVYVPWKEEGEQLVAELKGGRWDRQLFRSLGRYGVNVFAEHYQELLRRGDIELIRGTAVLVNMDLYHIAAGLSITEKEGEAIFM